MITRRYWTIAYLLLHSQCSWWLNLCSCRWWISITLLYPKGDAAWYSSSQHTNTPRVKSEFEWPLSLASKLSIASFTSLSGTGQRVEWMYASCSTPMVGGRRDVWSGNSSSVGVYAPCSANAYVYMEWIGNSQSQANSYLECLYFFSKNLRRVQQKCFVPMMAQPDGTVLGDILLQTDCSNISLCSTPMASRCREE